MSLEFLISKIKLNNFLLIGRAGVDIYPDPPGTKIEHAKNFVTHLGGSSANLAVELTKFGGKCSLLTRVSNDALGRFALNQLDFYGVNKELIKFEDNESRNSFAIVESTTEDHQSIIYRHKASDLFLNKEDIDFAKIHNYDCILITGTALAAQPSRDGVIYALDIAKKNNIPVVMDIDYRPYTWESQDTAKEIYNKAAEKCSGIIGNDDEFAVISGNYSEGLNFAKNLSSSCDLVIYKKGERGSITFTEDKEIKKGIFPVKPLKPTGAGDAFMGALIGALLKSYAIENSIEIGSAAAAIVVTKVGCAPAMPDLDEILNFMKNNNINEGEK
ncbi:5-dehydro-2-deoxygluconokinase [Pelagibacterales bacterium SAG-MED31]|nr:5-dehydro-2-deoxygluconokinase [Pelagibacterales bacterium SAG-MED31]